MYTFNSREELTAFIVSEVINTSEAMSLLNCTRQNIDDLITRGKLTPIKKFKRDSIFWKEDILQRLKKPQIGWVKINKDLSTS